MIILVKSLQLFGLYARIFFVVVVLILNASKSGRPPLFCV
jgi:hypothetical protein